MANDTANQFRGFSARRIRAQVGTPHTPTPLDDLVRTQLPFLPEDDEDTGSNAGNSTILAPLANPFPVPVGSPSNPFHSTYRPTSAPPDTPPRPLPPHMNPTGTPPATGSTNHELANAIALLAQTLQRSTSVTPSSAGERNNVREPDQFDGSEPTKLRSFFTQLELVFKARTRTFDTDSKKVTYAISYLKGTALQWFEPYLLEKSHLPPPLFMSDFEHFKEELTVNFGPYDATGAAEHDLENLRMPDNGRITKYITQFSRLATQVRWGTDALRYQFYKGLPARLKDRISEVGKPANIYDLRELAQSLDNRYWERRAEQAREPAGTPRAAPKPSSDTRSAPPARTNTSQNSAGTPKPSSDANRTAAKATPKPYADKLGKDGKLTPEERQRRFANNLCLFCAAPGHSASACPKKSSSAVKARAATAEESEIEEIDSEASEEPKN